MERQSDYCKEAVMKVSVDPVRCNATGKCVEMCPQVFRFQEGSKKAKVMLHPVPVQLRDLCREAAYHCPEDAIYIMEA